MNQDIQKISNSKQSSSIAYNVELTRHLPLDSVAFAEIYDDFTQEIGVSADFFIDDIMHNKPLLTTILRTEFGRIGIILLPVKNEDIYIANNLLDIINEGIHLAQMYGARSASLTGLIPSATNYGKDIDCSKYNNFLLTTGHASTVSAIVLNVTNSLKQTGRTIESETVACIGLGSIGMATINLMLSVLPHPKKIILCDLFARLDEMEKIKNQLVSTFDFKGEISSDATSSNSIALSKTVYDEATIMIGATNVPDIISTELLRSGTIIIDDSAPHIFDLNSCLERFKKQKDILVLQAGKLTLPNLISCVYTDFKLPLEATTNCKIKKQHEIMGCTLGSLLPLISKETPNTLGIIDTKISAAYHDFFHKQKIYASSLHCGNYYYQHEEIEGFLIKDLHLF